MTLKREHGDAAIKIICAAIPAIAVFFAISNQTTAIVVSIVSAAGVFLGFRLVSKITVPEAFALGYFSSFLEPITYAAGHDGVIRYENQAGQSVDQPLNKISVRFLVVLPEELNMGNKATLGSLSEILKRIQQSFTPGSFFITADGIKAGEKPFGVYLDAANPKELVIIDVPNNLRALTVYALREFGGASDSESQAKKLLAEYVSQLKKTIPELRVKANVPVTTLQASEFISGKRA